GLNEKRSRQSKKSRTPHRVFCDRRDRFRINPLYSSPDSMAELMAKCDLAISAGGGTVKELFAMGVVSLFVVQADNQILLRDYLQNEGLPLYLGTHNDVTAQQIYTEVTKLMNNPNERLRIRTIISSKVDRKGTSNIVAELKVYCIKRRQKVMKFGENFTPSPKNDIIIWGAGVAGRRCYELLKTFEAEDKVIAFVDSDKAIQGATLLNTVVHSPDFVSQESKADIIIATMWYHEVYPLIPNRSARNILVYCERIPIITPVKFELLSDTELYGVYQNDPVTIASIDILQYIRKHGLRVLFSIDTAVNFPGICRYWASEELSLSVYDKLTVVDVGAYDGDTIERWAKSYADKISKIYAFEPDDKTFVALKKNIEAWGLSGKTECFKNGLSNKNQTLSFINAGHMGSRIDSDGDSSITVMPLDELNITVEGKLCIKMDIEGAESEALEGAKETIKKYAPELAISVYHKYDDVLTIPKIIKSINPAYNCILRNGTHMECYASVERFS
ncbi:MAG: FkbM family methyltransferase, partial [Defluviitaleaceae bacterium]|nr:FkbM family methyltransferase [Defluviitaleaceae bacterium]